MGRYPLLVTLCVVLLSGAALILYDIWLCWRGGAAATISWHAYLAARDEPIIPLVLGLVIGILFGHLFWPNRGS